MRPVYQPDHHDLREQPADSAGFRPCQTDLQSHGQKEQIPGTTFRLFSGSLLSFRTAVLRSGPQFFSAAYIVKTRPRLLDHQRAEHAVKLMCICKQMIMEKYSPQFFIRKKAFHQSFIFSGSRDIIPAVCRPIGCDRISNLTRCT